MSFRYIRHISFEDGEIRQLERRAAAASEEANRVRNEIVTLTEQSKSRDKEADLSRLAMMRALRIQAVTSLEEQQKEIQLLEKELLYLRGQGVIVAPTDYINALAFSVDGRYLASASNDKIVRVYDMEDNFAVIWKHEDSCSPTAVAWTDSALFVGNMEGDLTSKFRWICNYQYSTKELLYKADAPVHMMQFNTQKDRLLLCSGADVLLFTKNSERWEFQDHLPRPIPFGEIDNFDIPDTVATGAHFLDDHNECLIAYLHDGFRKFKIDTWDCAKVEWGLGDGFIEKIGFSAKSPDSKSVVATNLHRGLDWYKITPEKLKKMSTSEEIQDQHSNIPLPVLFINNGQATIMGTTKGYAVIFEAKHGKKVQALKHGGDQTWVTALAYVETSRRRRLIATGDGNCGQRTKIVIWCEKYGDTPIYVFKPWTVIWRIACIIMTAGRIVLILLGIVFAVSLLLPTRWKELVGSRVIAYPAVVQVPTQKTSSAPSVTPSSAVKIKEILNSLGMIAGNERDPSI
ncbi:hypothetical protein F5878DRAFT_660440 [Lentinula raphanica]|uniref:WD40 repeat-like protein n=1 Tax=Lentinula raphanica TaxID=153919 RepID=A0AA38PAY2_9AGAR|nr:hypothetical protein F5878DRAFT_660440 [Lentinula raphanica]